MKYKSFKIFVLAVFVLIMGGAFLNPAPARAICNYIPNAPGNPAAIGSFTVSLSGNTLLASGSYIRGSGCELNGFIHDGSPSIYIYSPTTSTSISVGQPPLPICSNISGSCSFNNIAISVSSLASGNYSAEFNVQSTYGDAFPMSANFTIAPTATPYNVSATAGAGGSVTSASYNGTGGTVNSANSVTVTPPSSSSANFTLTPDPSHVNTVIVGSNPTSSGTAADCPLKPTGWAPITFTPGVANTYTTGNVGADCTYTFTFNSATAGVPVVTLTANPTTMTLPTNSTSLSWSATNSPTSCTASSSPVNADWNGAKSPTGSPQTVNNLVAGTNTFSLACSNASGSSTTASATVTVSSAAMSGTLTASDCQITAGNNSCLSSLSWTTTNPEGVSNVTSNTPVANTVVGGPANNGTSSASVSYGTRTFFLNNNTKSLVPTSPAGSGVIATATCASGTTWNGSICISAGGMTGTLTPASSTCTISSGASTCTRILAWTTTNPVAVSAVTNADGATPNPSASNNNTSQVFTIHYNLGSPSTFYLYNNMQNLATATVTPVCTAGTTWDGAICAPSTAMTGTLTSTTPTCTIASGASACINKVLSWTTTNPVATSSVSNSNGATPNPGPSVNNGSQGFTIQYNNSVATTFWLYNNGVPLASKAITPVCASGSGWDGTKCLAGLCSNGANNPPTCNTCTPPATYSLLDNKCVNLGLCLNGATNPPACTTNSGGTCLNGATNPPACNNFGAGTAGVCALTHYNCSVGTVNAGSKKSNTSNFTWTCDGVSGGASSPQCLELKKKPIFIEN